MSDSDRPRPCGFTVAACPFSICICKAGDSEQLREDNPSRGLYVHSVTVDDNADFVTLSRCVNSRGDYWLAEWRTYQAAGDNWTSKRISDPMPRAMAETVAKRWAKDYKLDYRP